MIAGLSRNNCKIFAIVSRNMPEINNWRELKDIELYEVDGYTNAISFPFKILKFFLYDSAKIKSKIQKARATVIYIPIISYWSWFINHVCGNMPFVYAMHDPVVHDSNKIFIKTMNDWLAANAKTVVILSDVFREYVRKNYKKTDKEIITIPSGNESIQTTKGRIEIVHYDNNKVNFLFQGQIAKYKGLDILAEAYMKLRKKYSNITLTVAGSGDFREYEGTYNRLCDCTVINRWLDAEEVTGLFNDKSVITVLPYLSATQSGVINVAMPNGSPIIATKCGGIMEQIVDNVTGYLIEPNNVEALYEKMEYVINHKEEWEFIRKNAYERMKSLDWDVLSGKLAEIL
jgi:glycosyltransferase involved in cell wall biosynthesis